MRLIAKAETANKQVKVEEGPINSNNPKPIHFVCEEK